MSTQVCKNFELGTRVVCGPFIKGRIIGTATYLDGYERATFGYVVQLDEGEYLRRKAFTISSPQNAEEIYISSVIVAADHEDLRAESI